MNSVCNSIPEYWRLLYENRTEFIYWREINSVRKARVASEEPPGRPRVPGLRDPGPRVPGLRDPGPRVPGLRVPGLRDPDPMNWPDDP